MDEQAGPGVFFSNNNNNNALLLPPPAGGPGLEPGEAAAAAAAAAAAGGGGGGGGVSASGAAAPLSASRAQYSVPGILHFLQHEWGRFEAERAEWEAERAELQVTPATFYPPHPRLRRPLPLRVPRPYAAGGERPPWARPLPREGAAARAVPLPPRAAAPRRGREGGGTWRPARRRAGPARRGAAPALCAAVASSPEFSGCPSRSAAPTCHQFHNPS